jgi:rhodanese-related sulfurtransferase
LAAEYQDKGFYNVKALMGGIDAWKTKGYPIN